MTDKIIVFEDGFTSQTIPTALRSGSTGAQGAAGIGIATVAFTSTTATNGLPSQEGATDTYTITFTDTTTTTYTITNGNFGNEFLSGANDPAVSLGLVGDFYINTTTTELFGPKPSISSWGSGLALRGLPGNADPFMISFDGDFTESVVTTIAAAGNFVFLNILNDNRTDKTTPINEDVTGHLILFDGTNWFDQGNFRGATGLTGARGSAILSGALAPLNTQGEDGDFYIELTDPFKIFGPKASGSWPTVGINIKGNQGIQGFQGIGLNTTDGVTIDAGTSISGGTQYTLTFDLVNPDSTGTDPTDPTTVFVAPAGPTGPSGVPGTELNLDTVTTSFTIENLHTYNMNFSSATTLTLPTAVLNLQFTLHDISGLIKTNNVTIARIGSEMIAGASRNRILSANYGTWTFYSNGTNWFLL